MNGIEFLMWLFGFNSKFASDLWRPGFFSSTHVIATTSSSLFSIVRFNKFNIQPHDSTAHTALESSLKVALKVGSSP